MKNNILNISDITINNFPQAIAQELTPTKEFVEELKKNLFQSFKQGFVSNFELSQCSKDKINDIYDNTVNCEDFEIEITKEGVIRLNIDKPSKAMKEALENLKNIPS
jgi:hypothetical protein